MHPLQPEVDAALAADPRVVAWGLVGSYGRGRADEWSDLDLLVAIADEAWTDDEAPAVWPSADVVVDARRNVRTGAHSTMTVHVRDGWPYVADWYLHPRSRLRWPSDCLVVRDRPGIDRVDATFAGWNAVGERREPLAPTDESRRGFRLRMVEVVAKDVARGDEVAARQAAAVLGLGPDDDLLDALEQVVGDDPSVVAAAVRRLVGEVRGRSARRG